MFTRSFANAPRRRAADRVRIVEVGARDGLQNETRAVPAATKMELVERLARTGLQTIEAGAFVHPRWVPQMAASDQVLASLLRRAPAGDITYQWLVPNTKGLDHYLAVMARTSRPPAAHTSSSHAAAAPPATTTPGAVDARSPAGRGERGGPRHQVSIFTAATEAFSQKNTNCSMEESVARVGRVVRESGRAGYGVRAYISVALGCPFEGAEVDAGRVAELAASLLEMGAGEVSVADTTGMGTARRTRRLLRALRAAGVRSADLAMHFHDTFGQALVNTVVALEHGVRTFDAAVGGLGGCPYSPGATGNVATEDLVYCLHGLGLETGLDLEELSRIGDWITSEIGKPNASSAGKATLARLRREADA